MNPNDISKFIEKARKDKGLTQRQLAKKLGISNTAISKWEHGYNLPDISMLEPLSEALDVDMLDLIKAQNITHEDNTKKKYTKAKMDRIKRRIITIIVIILSVIVSNFYTYCMTHKHITELGEEAVEVYEISSKDKDFSIDGYLIFNKEESILIINNIKYQGVEEGTKKYSNIINIDFHLKIGNKTINNYNIKKAKDEELNIILKEFRINQKVAINLYNEKHNFDKFQLQMKIKYKNDKRLEITADLNLKRKLYKEN